MTTEQPSFNWQEVVWRAWRYADDQACADHLFDLVADAPVGAGVIASIVVWGAFYGAVAGLLASLGLSMWDRMEAVLFLLGGAAAGGLIGLLLGRRLTWRQWLGRLSPEMPVEGRGGGGGVLALLLQLLLRRRAQRPTPGFSPWQTFDLLRWLIVALVLMVLGGPLLGLFFGMLAGLFIGLQVGLVGGLAGVVVVVPSFLLLAELAVGLFIQIKGLATAPAFLLNWVLGGLLSGMAGLLPGALAGGLGALLGTRPYAWEWRPLWSWWRGQPPLVALEAALAQACREQPAAREVWGHLLDEIAREKEGPRAPETLVAALESHEWSERFVARHALVALGGEAVEPLRSLVTTPGHRLQGTALLLLANVADETAGRLGERAGSMLCRHCLARCMALPIRLPGPDLTYYGCRACGQSRDFLDWPGEVVAVVDERMTADQVEEAGVLWVNWLRRRALFDFDRVQIAQAGDEEVERFAVHVGNDADPLRQKRYRAMRCVVTADSTIAENTRRILHSLFGTVECQ